jgi:pentatricopeptide repeat protein
MAEDYPAIEDHAAIGNLRTVALVARDGTIDWLCLPHLDSPSVFASLLDPDRAGRFRIAPPGPTRRGEQRYLEDTNVVETAFDTPGGRLVVTDLMPLAGQLDNPRESLTEPAVLRLVRAEGGPVDAEVEFSPRFGYADAPGELLATEHGWLAWAGADALTLAGDLDEAHVADDGVGPVLRARLRLDDGEQRALVARWGAEAQPLRHDEVAHWRDETVASWRAWVHKAEATGSRDWAQPHGELIIRSELALKLLTHAETGAIAAAATTSLPEEIGGVRNWDYRLAWIRDAGLAAQALFALGHQTEAHAFIDWAERAARDEGERSWGLQLLYGLHGEVDLEEQELPGLAGYRRSAPVRIGNGAVDQLQLDIFGELISAAYEIIRLGGTLDDDILAFLPQVADQACAAWQQPDFGLWELRNGPFSFVYSKVMVWMALERAERLARRGVIDGDVEAWRTTREQIAEEVLTRGFDPELGAFKQSYERPVLDASNLLLAMQEFLPFDDPRVQQNLDRTLADLADGACVHRYEADDGIAGGEGAFGLCSFWLVDALAMAGRVEEAEEIFEAMAASANHVGLFSEMLDPVTGAFLGNFPQAFTHLGLINSSLYLAHARGRELPIPSLIGSHDHRREP